MTMTTSLDDIITEVLGPSPASTSRLLADPGPRLTGTGLMRVRLDELHSDPDNARERMTGIAELAATIVQAGLLQPIIVRRDEGQHLVVVCGHRRLAALRYLRWVSVDVIVRREMRPDQVLVAMLAENGQRVGLDPIEEARAFRGLKLEGHLSDAGVAEKAGRTQVYVSGRIALLALPADEQEEIRAGQRTIGESIARARVRTGKVRARDTSGWHLANDHPLARRASARCARLEHPRGHRLAGVACGVCWEAVIRADERQLVAVARAARIHQAPEAPAQCSAKAEGLRRGDGDGGEDRD
jgi:ParB family transcriptional regulator, chromosome partitioning protein